MKSIVLTGDKGEGACETCQAFTPLTYEYRALKRNDGTVVERVMQGICDRCENAIVIAGQSTHRIARAIDDRKKTKNEGAPTH